MKDRKGASRADRLRAAGLGPQTLARPAELAALFQIARPFKHVVIDGFLDPVFCRQLVDEFPAYDPARFRNAHGHAGKARHEDVKGLGPAYERLDSLVSSGTFRGFIGSLTGIPGLLHDPSYLGAGAHENLDDMELDPHVDFTLHPKSGLYRRVNLLLYLNPEWDDAWGGSLELHEDPWRPAGADRVKRIAPLFNRCVIFETGDSSWHGFEALRLPAGGPVSRRSFALYLYAEEKPAAVPAIPYGLTVFVDRPLPARFSPGLTLTEDDVRLLNRLIVRRDWKLRHAYRTAIQFFNRLPPAVRRGFYSS